MSSHGASGPRLPPPAKRIGYTGQPLDARKLRNINKWPAGVLKKGRLGFYPTQHYLSYKDGHLANACTVLPHLLLKSRVDMLRAHEISVMTEQARALLHNTLTQDDLKKVLATQALVQSVDDDDEMQEASAASWHVRILGKEGEQCLRTKALTPFLLDSGAMRHMTTQLDLLHDYCPSLADRRVRVTGAFGSGGFTSCTGKLRFPTGGKDMVLRNILYVPGLEAELVSLNCLIEDDYNVGV
ncbi:BQ5605_C045g12197 [Microbotryum silenes-dioicae]|uniref:BQ5605_C045g12197 protein n=1 Tax=Microbotryum silenes-dioicae TaxID=796604 RepID=A0A2X0PIG9_9BASI|nr:BQ5605_C045g12197 [Microbotryum silenes-dioicae]